MRKRRPAQSDGVRRSRSPGARGRGAPEGRDLAKSILAGVDAGRRLDVAWEAVGAAESVHRAWVRALVYGVVRLRGRLDHVLAQVSGRDLEALDPPVRMALRMGAYEILEMKSVPAYAAVSEAVEAVKAGRSRAASGLVNAVLRKLAAASPGTFSFPCPGEDLEGFLSTWGSHPRWLVRRWMRAFGPQAARTLVEANNEEPATYLRPVGETAAELVRRLADAGIAATISPAASARPPAGPRDGATGGPGASARLGAGEDPAAALAAAPCVVQDPAASLVVEYAAPEPGSVVADLCAAPGGKALALSAVAGAVVAADVSVRRLARVAGGVERLRRAGAEAKVWPVAADARSPATRGASTTLLDVPCSATGVVRRRPDARWRLGPDGLRTLVRAQRVLLDGVAAVVPSGGVLVYATCSLEPEENGGQVRDFLMRHPKFRIEPGPAPPRFLDAAGCLAALPAQGPGGHDGAFAARLRKVAR